MERKRRIRSCILIAASAFSWLAPGCSYHETEKETEVRISFSCDAMQTKAGQPDEDIISDISLMIFDENGSAEECVRLDKGISEYTSRLVAGRKYHICACANMGRRIYADDIRELDEIRYHLAYPDDYRNGIPMYVRHEFTAEEGGDEINLRFERMMAKITLRIDRRRLSDDVEMYVRSVKIGNCPRVTNVFKPNKVHEKDDCFPAGFSLGGYETDNLNDTSESGLSKPVSLYMLENMQGSFDNVIDSDSDKVFGKDDHRNNVCSYIELNLDYTSPSYISGSEGLTYRFYLGENRNDLNIERNCHYQIIIVPEDDGLSEDSWRVDKSDLTYCGPTYLQSYPEKYITGNIGEEIHIWCELLPENAPFDIGEDYMRDDKANGIYDYVMDDDGHGVTLTLTGPGRGLIYMEAGPPINESTMFIIEVNLP